MTEKITDRPRTLKELAAFYHVSKKTFNRWLRCNALRGIRRENGYYFSIVNVRIIVEHLGEP